MLQRVRPVWPRCRCTPKAVGWNARRFVTSTGNGRRRVAIIGSGPAGFYAARRLLQKTDYVSVDMYEQLPVPFGLVRYGVAPDHPEVKNCQDTFDEVAASDRFNFIGHVAVGSDVPLEVLRDNYDSLLFAYGASQDRLLGIPGEHLTGVHSARAFVGWYNGLPEFQGLSPNLDVEQAVVIGNGNVALDVARILLAPLDALRKTDIAAHALDALSRSRIKEVSVIGRRGPMQAAFTIKELRELLTLPGLGFNFDGQDQVPTADYISSLPRLEQRKYRFSNLLLKGSSTPPSHADKQWSLLSLLSPISFQPTPEGDSLAHIEFQVNDFQNPNDRFSKSARVISTDAKQIIPAGIAFRSIGYKSEALPHLSTIDVGFDTSRGIVLNDGVGRALDNNGTAHIPRMYCTGWVKNGPTGVIASTMEDAFTSADAMILDMENKTADSASPRPGWSSVCRDPKVRIDRPISWQDWQRIDQDEKDRGKIAGKEREKFTSIEDMLEVIYPQT